METILNEARKTFNSNFKDVSDLCRKTGCNFDTDFLDIAVWIANADGVLSQREIDFINELFNLSYTRREITEIYRRRVCAVDLPKHIQEHYAELERQSSDLANYYYMVILMTAGIMMLPDGDLHSKEHEILEALEQNGGILVDDITGGLVAVLNDLAKREYPLHETLEFTRRVGKIGSERQSQGMLVSAERCFLTSYLGSSLLVLKYGDNEALRIQAMSAEEMGISRYGRFDLLGAEKYTKTAVSLYLDLYQKTQWIGVREAIESCSAYLTTIQSEIKRIQEAIPHGIIIDTIEFEPITDNYSDEQKIIQELMQRIELGDSEAEYELGMCYMKGKHVDRDETKAIELLREAAEHGHSGAQCIVADALYRGSCGLEKDHNAAIEMYKKAEEQNNMQAIDALGEIGWKLGDAFYLGKDGVPQDYRRAVYWYRFGAARANRAAQCSLAIMYEKGLGVDQDMELAWSWYEEAAYNGDGLAVERIRERDGINNNPEEDVSFKFDINNIEKRSGSGYVIAGRVSDGIIQKGDKARIILEDGGHIHTTIWKIVGDKDYARSGEDALLIFLSLGGNAERAIRIEGIKGDI